MTLREFVLFIRVSIRISKKRPIFVSFKNTKPPVGALFYEIDEPNKVEDGFMHVTYSGEENVCGSNEEQEHGDKISFENENSQGTFFSRFLGVNYTVCSPPLNIQIGMCLLLYLCI